MRECSEEYIANMTTGRTFTKEVVGRIEDMNSESFVEFTDANIIKKTFTYINQCTSDNKFTVGGVFAGKLQLSLTGMPSWIGMVDKLRIRFTVINNTGGIVDRFPSQWFIVDKLSQKRKNVNTQVTITAYDYMTMLDRPMMRAISGENAYSVFSVICTLCNLECGNNAEDMLLFPNATEYLFVDPADCPTYRDAVQQIATLLCGFATMNPENKLEIKQFDFGYHSEPARIIPKQKRIRNGTKIEGITEFYDVHGVTYNFSGEEVILGAGSVGYGILDFGYIYIVPRIINPVDDAILTAWRTFARNVRYEIFASEIVPDFSWELGDRLRLDQEGADETFISKMIYRHSAAMEIGGEGESEATANALTGDWKDQIRTGTQIGRTTMVSIAYTNADALEITSEEFTLVSVFRFSALETTHVMMNLMLPIVSNLDGDVEVLFNINGTDGDDFKGHIERGNNLVTLAQEYEFAKNDIILMRVYARAQYYETDNRRQTARIVSIEEYIERGGTLPAPVINTQPPTFNIGAEMIRSFIWAKGIDAGIHWDGFLFVADNTLFVPMGAMGIVVSSDSALCRIYPVRSLEIADPAYYEYIMSNRVDDMTDSATITFSIADQVPRCGEGLYAGMDMGSILL